MNLARLVVLISGNGSNLQAVLDACAAGRLNAQVVGVVSNKRDAYGLVRAGKAGVPTAVLPKFKEQERSEYDRHLADLVAAFEPDWVVLAGWMRLLSNAFLLRFPNRVVNLHPALPGTFPGTHAIERAYEAYQAGLIQHTGVMVHLVPDEGVDDGPLLAMADVPFYPDDSLEELEERIHGAEHDLLVNTLARLVQHPGMNGRE
jgi:phosphoribosylglycinamide formyltransferase 1